MKNVLLGMVVCFAVGFATACSDDEGGEDSESSGGSGATTGGSGGAATGGSSGAATGGSSGATTGGSGGVATGGSSGAATGGSSGAATGGSSGAATGGSAGSSSGGQSGSSGSGGSGGVGGTGGSGGSGGSLNCTETTTGCLCAPVSPQPDDVPICTRQSINGICCSNSTTGFCSCRTWTCENDSLGCTCGAGSDGTLTACSGDYGVCCMSVTGTASSCYCDDILTECVGTNDMEVENCEVSIAPCGPGEVAVDACKG